MLMRCSPGASRITAMAQTTIRLLIELQLAAAPIAGTIQPQPNGQSEPFTGWLQLTQAIETLRRSAAQERSARP
jgi:hypothetical protein